MAAFAKSRIDDLGEAREEGRSGLGAAGGASLALHAGVAALIVGWAWATLREPMPERGPGAETFRVIQTGAAVNTEGASEEVVTDARATPETVSEAVRLFVPPPSLRAWTPPPRPRVSERSEPRAPTRTEPARDWRAISYEEHLRRQGAEPAVQRSRSSVADTVASVGPGTRINADQVRGTPGVGVVSRTASDGAVESAMAGYFGDLVGRLRDTHELPGGMSDVLSAEVQFTVAANGAVSGVRIVRSSGSKDFDRSVLEAFGRLKMPARPDKKTDTQRLTFRIMDA